MWPSIKRWRDWLMNDLLPTYRIGSQPRALHYSFEKAGLTLHDQPVPWNAEAVLVEATLRLPSPAMRRPADFHLRVPGPEPRPADGMRKLDNEGPREEHRYSVWFRLPPLTQTTTVELFWRTRSLGQLELPLLSRDAFAAGLRLLMPTLSVRLGEHTVACQTFVASQCKGVVATALLTSPTSLAPLAELELEVEFKSERTGASIRVPLRLSSSQLSGRQALLTLVPKRYPRGLGVWTARWLLGDRELATGRLRAISLRQFQRSLRVADTRFVLQAADGSVSLSRQLPPPERRGRVGPCFLVCSREAGMAGLCPLRVAAQVAGAVRPPLLYDENVLVTDGPALVAPGTLDPSDLVQVSGFDLSLKGRSLCLLPLSPAPEAAFNSEGGFKPPPDFAWTPAAEDE